MPDAVDRELLQRFVQGDEAAFESLFRQFEAEVYGWILRITRDPAAAEDALVDAFSRAYRSRARFDASRSFGAWMRRIATKPPWTSFTSPPQRARSGLQTQEPSPRAIPSRTTCATRFAGRSAGCRRGWPPWRRWHSSNRNRTPTSPRRWTCRLARSSHGSSARPGC